MFYDKNGFNKEKTIKSFQIYRHCLHHDNMPHVSWFSEMFEIIDEQYKNITSKDENKKLILESIKKDIEELIRLQDEMYDVQNRALDNLWKIEAERDDDEKEEEEE